MSERLKKRLQKVVNQITEGHVVHLNTQAGGERAARDPEGLGHSPAEGLDAGEPHRIITQAPAPTTAPVIPPLGNTPRAGATSASKEIEPFRGVEPHQDIMDFGERVPLDRVDIAVDPWTDSAEVFEKPEDVDYDYQGDDWDSSQPFATGEFPYREEPGAEPPHSLTGKVDDRKERLRKQIELLQRRYESLS